MQALAAAITKMPPDAALALRLALFSGMRIGEVLALDWSDVALEAGLARLKQDKAGFGRDVMLSPVAAALLRPPAPVWTEAGLFAEACAIRLWRVSGGHWRPRSRQRRANGRAFTTCGTPSPPWLLPAAPE